MMNGSTTPVHVTPPLVYTGVTLTVALTGVVPVLLVENGLMLFVPDAPNPMDGVVFVHVYDVPVPVKAIVLLCAPLQTVISAVGFTDGVGFTV